MDSKQLNKKRRAYFKALNTHARGNVFAYFFVITLYDISAIVASICLGQLVEQLQNPVEGNFLWLAILVPFLFALCSMIIIISTRITAGLSVKGFTAIKIAVLSNVLNAPRLTRVHEEGDLLNMVTSDAGELGSQFLRRKPFVIETVLALLAYFVVMCVYALPLAVLMIVVAVPLVIMLVRFSKLQAEQNKLYLNIMGTQSSQVLALVGGAKMLERFGDGAREYALFKYNESLKKSHKIFKKKSYYSYAINAIWGFVMLAMPAMFAVVGIVLSAMGWMSLAGAFMALPLVSYTSAPISSLSSELQSIEQEQKVFERMLPVIDVQ